MVNYIEESTMHKGIIYRGKSLIDGKPIVVLATMGNPKKTNTKTGAMLQTYILVDNGKLPVENNRTGADYSICGECEYKGTPNLEKDSGTADERICYVVIAQGATAACKSFLAGNYPDAMTHNKRSQLGAGRMVRLGSYGDPAAVPSHVWDSLLWQAKGHTAYTHQSGIDSADVRRDMMMISADNIQSAKIAWSTGARTFRVIKDYSEMDTKNEIACPADTRGLQCQACGLCRGNSVGGKSIAIAAHGNGKVYL
jgi:hypothetical protein